MLTDNNNEINLNHNFVFKSNKLIEIGFTTEFKLSVNEYKIINYFISRVKFGDKKLRTFEANVLDLDKNFGIEGNGTYNQLKTRYMTKLLSKSFFISNTKAFNWFSNIESEKGIFRVCFNKDLEEFLVGDFWKPGYTKYNFWCISNLKSFFSIRVYELIKQHQSFKFRTFKIKDLKYFLGISDKYSTYSNFKKRVLNTVIKEINEKTDIKLLFEENRLGREVVSITFHCSKNLKNIKKRTNKKIEDAIIELSYTLKNNYGFTLDDDLFKDLLNTKGYDLVKKYADNFQEFLDNHNMTYKDKFFYHAVFYEWKPTKRNNNIITNNTPEQSKNFEQREYDDEFYENLYDNF